MTTAACFAPRDAGSGEPVQLAMQRLWLTGRILPAGAHLTVQHVFQSAESRPLEVVYAFPLPRDAALRSFRIVGEGFEAHSELRQTEAAVKAYEEGIAQGSLSTLARQYGDGLVNLTVGNIRPGEQISVYLELLAGIELRDEGFRFRFPFTLAPVYHPRARCAVVDGAGEMELPADEFGDVILPPVRPDASALHQVGFDLAVECGLAMDEIASPSHTVRIRHSAGTAGRVSLAAEKDIPDRDLVLDAHYRQAAPQLLTGKGRFAAVLPSTCFGANTDTPRRVVILLDRSGSMQGTPIAQASKAIDACLAALSDKDLFGLVAFDDRADACEPHLLAGTRENRERTHQWLASVHARGGTELVHGFQKAVELLEHGGGDVLILTDGQVGGTERILAEARQTNTRLHCLGIGSASQDRFLALLARETGGVSRFVTPRERVDLPAVDLFASIGRPVASGLKAPRHVDPEPPSAVFAGTPVLLFGKGAELAVTWDGGGSLTLPMDSAIETGDAVWLLQGARLIADFESRYAATEALLPLEKRRQSRVANRLRELSETYGLASREMSLVAVVKRAGDRPGEIPETRVVPVGMPQDTAFGAYFHAPAPFALSAAMMPPPGIARAISAIQPPTAAPAPDTGGRRRFGFLFHREDPAELPEDDSAPCEEDSLLLLAARLDSDGGMPGKSAGTRAAVSALALLAFVASGSTESSGPFRSHVARLVHFLESLAGLDARQQTLIDRILASVRRGQAPGDWLRLAVAANTGWIALERVFGK